jgi:hypothetical protein
MSRKQQIKMNGGMFDFGLGKLLGVTTKEQMNPDERATHLKELEAKKSTDLAKMVVDLEDKVKELEKKIKDMETPPLSEGKPAAVIPGAPATTSSVPALSSGGKSTPKSKTPKPPTPKPKTPKKDRSPGNPPPRFNPGNITASAAGGKRMTRKNQ